ncbi:DUF4230 domain-containing protein [Inediibacterium massiliense]|uniref:DUF4230 domain-containing protein n=1 Tax=Inediibacterium massiliense TaxID=1658111 RepID=UPI0006B4F78E|nr:DUF4230 domain-containing protein [Inediibacterium massiliense]
MKKFKNITIFILIGMVIGLGVLQYGNFKDEKESISAEVVEQTISQMSELVTIKYNYKNVVAYKNARKFNGVELPFTKKSFLIVYTGYIKAGVDLKSVDVKMISNHEIDVTIDQAKILDNVLNEEDVTIYDENSALLNPLKFGDLMKVLTKEKKKVEKEVVEKGFLKEANEYTKKLMETNLKSMGFEKVNIRFR